jgi:hypothetical protein
MNVPTLTVSKVHHFLDIRFLLGAVINSSGSLVRLPY